MQILGTGTKQQKAKVEQALRKYPAIDQVDVKVIVFNRKHIQGMSGQEGHGFAYYKTSHSGNAIHLAGKCPVLDFVSLHELGHIVMGQGVDDEHTEEMADNFARYYLDN